MIIDFCAFIGSWPTYPVSGDPEAVQNSLRNYGVSKYWCHRWNWPGVETRTDVTIWSIVRQKR